MEKEKESWNEPQGIDGSGDKEQDLSEQLSQLGKQVSEFMKETEKLVENDKTPKQIDLDVTRNLEAEVQRIIQKVDREESNREIKPPVKDENQVDASTETHMKETPSSEEIKNTEERKETVTTQEAGAPEISSEQEEKQDFLDQDSVLVEISDSLAEQISQVVDEDEANQLHMVKKKKRKKRILIGSSIFGVVLLTAVLLCFTKAGQKFLIKHFVGGVVYDSVMDYTTDTPTPTEALVETTVTPTPEVDEHQDEVVNILLLGLEEIGSAQNSDTMIIASLNRNTNELSIISLMRDLYVDIPGHGYHKLNSAYAKGGISLLYQTLQNNLGVTLDGYVLVNFTTFEKIVDLLGGVKITLNQKEAQYLNSTNYISNPANRKVISGTQIMNGNQALGYCRVRYVSTGKEANDFGRTARHRAVLNAMFDKLKDKNIFELINFMNKVFSNVDLQTDIPRDKFSDYLTEVVDLNIKELQQYRIPADNGYHDDKVYIGGGSHKQWVLIPNSWDETKQLLHEYIYGKTCAHSEVTNTPMPTMTPSGQ